jgi:hypothetical protein
MMIELTCKAMAAGRAGEGGLVWEKQANLHNGQRRMLHGIPSKLTRMAEDDRTACVIGHQPTLIITPYRHRARVQQ